jgi:hypothetical protein
MESIVPYVIWASLIITGLSLVAIVLFGIRGLTFGHAEPLTLVLLGIPTVILIISGLVMDSWAEAAVVTFLILLVLTIVSLLLSSTRSLLGF